MENSIQNEIIKLLTEDARYTPNQIAAMLGIEEKQVKDAVKQLEESGVIVKYSAIINSENLNLNVVQALIEVKVTPKKLRGFDAVAEEINAFSEVSSLYLMSGGFDIAIFVEGKTLGDISRFVSEKLSTIDGVLSTATHFILKKYKVEGQVTVKSEGAERQLIHA